jgi:hypothetical protein
MKSDSVTYASLGAATCIALITCLAGALAQGNNSPSGPVVLTVASEGGNKSSPLLYGIMFEVSNLALYVKTSLTDLLSLGNGSFRYGIYIG